MNNKERSVTHDWVGRQLQDQFYNAYYINESNQDTMYIKIWEWNFPIPFTWNLLIIISRAV